MIFLQYTLKRIQALIEEINFLMECEFPYKDSNIALKRLKRYFNDLKNHLESLSNRDEELVKQNCSKALDDLFIYLPLIGFILRSTNIRNAFEFYRPLRRLSKHILNINDYGEVHVVLSSEWDYSPFTYWGFPGFEGFVFIGLPAHESGNPLLIPLVGHELGHHIWKIKKIPTDSTFQLKIKRSVIDCVKKKRWAEYIKIFSDLALKNPDDFDSNFLLTSTTISTAEKFVMKQSEETFCDFVALRVFGKAYLDAFAYLLSPNNSGERNMYYPSMRNRVHNLLKAAKVYNINYETNYHSLFNESLSPMRAERELFQLKLSDDAMDMLIDDLIVMVNKSIDESYINSDRNNIKLIKKRFDKLVPAENCKSIADILNAAWEIYNEHLINGSKIWKNLAHIDSNNQDKIFKDLILKNIEVFEIGQILQNNEMLSDI